MKVLVCCEKSQAITSAFRLLGVEAYSNDISTSSHVDFKRSWHIQGDARKALYLENWDLVVAHPPCTYLSKAGATSLYDKYGNIKDYARLEKGFQAAEFFKVFYDYPGRIMIENPVPLKIFNLPPHSQVVDYACFGSSFHKKTYLWLKKLPPLMSIYSFSNVALPFVSYQFGSNRQEKRSVTPEGFAFAVASQFTDFMKSVGVV